MGSSVIVFIFPFFGIICLRLTDDAAERVKPTASVDEAAWFIGKPRFDFLLILEGRLLGLEGPVKEAVF